MLTRTPPLRLPKPEQSAVALANVERDLILPAGSQAAAEMDQWRRHRSATAPVLSGFIHRRIFAVQPAAIAPLLAPDISKWPFPPKTFKDTSALKCVDDMTTGIPLALCMHWFVEETGKPPSWPDIVAWMNTPLMRPHFFGPAWDLWQSEWQHRHSQDRWNKAMAWRLGNAYLSFLREIDFLTRMRHTHKIDISYHIVADAVLRIDFWQRRNLICLYLPNDYRNRKRNPLDLLGHEAGFTVHDVTFSTKPTGWASVTVVSEADASALAGVLSHGPSSLAA